MWRNREEAENRVKGVRNIIEVEVMIEMLAMTRFQVNLVAVARMPHMFQTLDQMKGYKVRIEIEATETGLKLVLGTDKM